MKICVAIPSYDQNGPWRLMHSLLKEQALAIRDGDILTINVLSSQAGIAQARNQLATEFLNMDFDRLVFLDSDITFEEGALLKLAHRPEDFVGGAYRFKKLSESYPVSFINDGKPKWTTPSGLLEVEGLPTGFLALSRNVFQKFLDKFPERSLAKQSSVTAFCFFQMPFVDGHLYGEDLYFCREWIEMGEKIYLDPEIKLVHWDYRPTPYFSHIGAFLKAQVTPEIISSLDDPFKGQEVSDDWMQDFKGIKSNDQNENALIKLKKNIEKFSELLSKKEIKNELSKSSLP